MPVAELYWKLSLQAYMLFIVKASFGRVGFGRMESEHLLLLDVTSVPLVVMASPSTEEMAFLTLPEGMNCYSLCWDSSHGRQRRFLPSLTLVSLSAAGCMTRNWFQKVPKDEAQSVSLERVCYSNRRASFFIPKELHFLIYLSRNQLCAKGY